jgi:hypothetical protein
LQPALSETENKNLPTDEPFEGNLGGLFFGAGKELRERERVAAQNGLSAGKRVPFLQAALNRKSYGMMGRRIGEFGNGRYIVSTIQAKY